MRQWALSTLAAISVLAAACAPAGPQSGPSGPTTGGQAPPTEKRAANQSLTVAKVGLPGSVSPEISSSNNEIFLTIFDPLLMFGSGYVIKPAVAEKWEFRPADNAWRFTLRKDMEFSNGDKLTADDVVYSVNLAVDKKQPTQSYFPAVTKAVKVDDYTVDIISKSPDVSVLNGAPWMYVLNAKYHQRVGGPEFGLKPVGSGPYELLEYKPADTIAVKLRAAKHAFRTPIASEVRFRAIPELGQQVSGLRTGDIDIAQSNFVADQVDQIKGANLGVIQKLTGNVTALFSQPEAEARNTPLRDKRVRQALNYAVNKDVLVQSLFKGYAQSAGQLGVPESPFWDPNVKPYAYDVATAKKLLAEAGYPNGFKLPVGIEYTPQTANPNLVLALQASLKEVGVDAEVKSYEFATFLDKYYGRNQQQKGDLFIQSLGDSNGMFSQGRGLYDCSKTGFEIWWCSKEFNRLYDQAIQEPDATKRAQLMRQANQVFRDDVPQIFLVATSGFLAHSQKIKGLDWTTALVYTYDSAYRVE